MASKPWATKIRYGEFEIVGAREKKPRLMGEGSFGKTFEAERQDRVADSVIKTSVALKVLNPSLLSSESKKLQFVQELLALTRFKHPNLIHYIRCGDEDGEVFYAMELCRGGDLAKLVKRYGALPERAAALIGMQVAAGLREVHQRHRLVHRDIKPSNIMLVDELEKSLGVQHLARRFEDQDSLCRIVDFGLVDFALNAQEEGSVPLRQRFVGSPMYASPEQVREQPVDGRSDIYSLGLTLWYLVQGKGPLLDPKGAELRDQKEAMRRHTDLSTEHSASFPPNLSEPFWRLLAKMVAKRPEERFASAGELQAALRKYLDDTAEQSAVSKFSVTRTSRPLEDVYRLGEEFPSRIGKKCFSAVEATTGHEVKLTIVEDLESDRVTMDVEAVTEHLAGQAELTWAQDFPDTMLRVSEVIHASDMLAFAEEPPGGLPLSEVLRARARERRTVSFAEAVVLLRPVADALDYLIQHGCTRVYLPCEEVWVLSEQLARQATGSGPAVMLPFAEWENPQVRFSMVTLPSGDAESSVASSVHQTVSGSVQSSDSSGHPIAVFARLLYRILNGSEIATAAAYLPTAYVQTASLGAASNNLIRDLVCQMAERQNVGAVLTEICINEGVIQPTRQPAALNTRTGALRTLTHLPTQQPSTVYPPGAGSAQVSAAGSHTVASHATGTQSPAARTAGTHATGTPVSGTQPPHATQSARPTSATTAVPTRTSATGFGSQSIGGSSFLGGDTINISGEEICQVVRAAEVISPYDRERRVIKIPARQWMPLGKVRCPYTQRFFRLPKKLDALPAEVVAPGLIHSPYADPGQNMRVAWEHWVAGTELICSETGKEIVLPQELPLPEGILPPGTTGRIMSPYAPGEQFAVSADYWQPGIEVLCPITGHAFLMPRELPPLEAIAELNKPGLLTSPYAQTVSWQIPPPDWTAGRRIVCPSTHKELVLPIVVERWVPEVRVADLSQRLVFDPFHPDATIQVPGASWMPDNIIKTGEEERGLRLPSDLPPLDAEIIRAPDGTLRDDAVRSPYTGDTVLVALEDWLPGKFIRCPRTGVDMVLPESLPRRIPQGTLSAAKRGFAISPFASDREFRVPPEQWVPGGEITCPATGRPFLLPPSLPLLEGSVPVGRLGVVISPFASKTEIGVAIEDWEPGKRLKCPVTGREFQLPADLEEWIEDGEWVPMQPGVIRSPLKPNAAVNVPEASWKAGALIVAPGTSRHFRIPAGITLPSLALEKAALAQALSEPESSDADAATALAKTFPEATSKLVRSIRMRHRMASTEERLRAQETGEALPNEPGYVRSPYGSRPRIVVPPAKWVEPGASIHCTETGRRFLLPANLPPLIAALDPSRPGWIASPFDSSQPFEIEPAEWEPGRTIRCALTGHPLRLPARLPDWKPVAEVPEGHGGEVISPFAPDVRVTLAGTDWVPGKEVRCPQTHKAFLLPQRLPPLVAKKLRPGSAESPYTGRSLDLPAAQWFPGAKVECPITHRIFLLPAELPEKHWPGTVVSPGVARSPYGSHPEVSVPGTEWLAGASIACPETGRHFLLPDKLPPLLALLDDSAPGEARSPYLPPGDARGIAKVTLRDWQPGFRLSCPVTRQPFLLPDDLPVWEGVAAIPSNQPVGTVESPYRPKAWVKVPPRQWLPGERLQCPDTKRFFTLPENLPLLEARVVEAGRGIVASPFAEGGNTQTVPEDQWKPEGEVVCQDTGRTFRLPRKLGALKKAPPPVIAKVPDPEDLDTKPPETAQQPTGRTSGDLGPRKRPAILPWAIGALAAALAVGGYLFFKPGGDSISDQTATLIEDKKLQGPIKDEVTDRARYVVEEAALRDAFAKGDAAAITSAFDAWNTRWQNLLAAEKDDTRKTALLLERQSALRAGQRWTVQEFKDAVAKLDSWKKPADAERFITEARASQEPGMVEAAWSLAFARAGSSGAALGAVMADAWTEIKTGKAPAHLKTAFVERATAAPQALLAEVLESKNNLQPDEIRPFIAKAKTIPDLKDQALLTEAQTMQAGDPKLRLTYLEAARGGSKDAIEWLFKNVIASAPSQSPLAADAALEGTVSDPFAAPGSPPKTLKIPAAQWKPGAQIQLTTPEGIACFSLPDEKTLPPLRLQLASLDKDKTKLPAEATAWKGSTANPFGTGELAIDRSLWYPGAELAAPDNPLLKVILPDTPDFPLLQTTPATDVEIARKEFKGEPGNAKLIHPATDKQIEIPWTQWKPGNRITADAKGDKCPPFMLRTCTPEELDPQLPCIGPVSLVLSPSSAKEEDKLRLREVLQAKSPYTGNTLVVAVKEWKAGGHVRDTTGDLASAGVHLTLTLPAEVPPIPVYKIGTDADADMSGNFELWDELAGAWSPIRFDSSGEDGTSDFLAYLTTGNNTITRNGRKFTVRSSLTVRTMTVHTSSSKKSEVGVDSLTGRKLSLDSMKKLREALNAPPSTNGIKHGMSSDARNYVARDGVTTTISPSGDSKPLQGSAGTNPQGGSTPPKPARPPKPPPAPPAPPPLIKPGDIPSGYRSVVLGGGNFSSRVFRWNSKVGAWVSENPVRSYSSVSDLAKDAEASLSRGSKSFPRGSSVRVTSDGYIYVTPP